MPPACFRPTLRNRLFVALFGLLVGAGPAGADEPKKAQEPDKPADSDRKLAERTKEIAGVAEFLRSVPKHFATLKAVDAPHRRVSLLIDGETLAKDWELMPEAEVKIAGWWGRIDQLTVGDRVWVWFKTNRGKQPTAVSMLADEPSEQDIHNGGVTVESTGQGKLTIKPLDRKSRTLDAAGVQFVLSKPASTLEDIKAGTKVYVQSAGDQARLIFTKEAFETRRQEQRDALRQRWLDEGLPGTVMFLHPFSGEMDYILDHEAMRWGRSLKPGNKVTLATRPPMTAVVKSVKPWREHTQLRLVAAAADQTELAMGQRIGLRMAAPPPDVETASLPPDVDRPRTKEERIDWFLASVYCTCGIKGDRCTGHFYTLASCNVNGCGAPNAMRQRVAEMIGRNLTDRQIFEELLKDHGPALVQQHLLP
jgi:hypothetical protein